VLWFSCEDNTSPHGCLDSQACNYNPNATIDNNSCWYADDGCLCQDGQGLVADDCGVCNGDNSTCDGDIYLGVSSVGLYNLEVSGVNLTCELGICYNSSGEYDKVDPGEITYTYEYLTGEDDDPDTDEWEEWAEDTGSFTLTANTNNVDKMCLLTLISVGFGAAIEDVTCADIEE